MNKQTGHWPLAALLVSSIAIAVGSIRAASFAEELSTVAFQGLLQGPTEVEELAQGQLSCPPYEKKALSSIALQLRKPGGPIHDCFEEVNPEADLVEHGDLSRCFPERVFHWRASQLSHHPLYFEDVSLERYGHTHVLQPAVSGLKFFATVPILPYKIGLDHPSEGIYTLGYKRAGSCTPAVKERLPFRLKAAALEAGAATGLIFLFP